LQISDTLEKVLLINASFTSRDQSNLGKYMPPELYPSVYGEKLTQKTTIQRFPYKESNGFCLRNQLFGSNC
jgi:hypothetical protein